MVNSLRYSRMKPVNSGIKRIFSHKENTVLIHSKGTLKDYSEGLTDMTVSVIKVKMIEIGHSNTIFGNMNQYINKDIKEQR